MAKKIPVRMCVGCREHKPKTELVRVVRSPEGEISVDFTGKKNGRGVYVCPDAKCLNKAQKQNALGRALGCEIGEEIYETLVAQLEEKAD